MWAGGAPAPEAPRAQQHTWLAQFWPRANKQCRSQGNDAEVLLSGRPLSRHMFPLVRQVQIAADNRAGAAWPGPAA